MDSTYSNVEVIVNDDASTDDTREIVEGFADERVRFFQNESNLGVPGNWNRALERASGEFVGLLNHDDLYGPFWLTFAVHMLERYPHIGWVATAFRILDEKNERVGIVSRFAETREYSRGEVFLCVARSGALGPAYIARRQVLKEIGYYDERTGPFADHDLHFRLASRYPLCYSNNLYHAAWRLHADNLTHRVGLVERTAIALRILHKMFSDDALPEELRQYKKACYISPYRRVMVKGEKLLEEGDLETLQRLIHLLYADGYGT